METNPLYSAYLGELYGIAFFTAFANKYSDDSHIHKWQLLINVEQITATKLKTELTSISIPYPGHGAKVAQQQVGSGIAMLEASIIRPRQGKVGGLLNAR
ncbi:hypothetical protein C9J03_03575 [Photobacterium gaetbulicola]|uniref:Uncharacterized protein n=1 Tax=Photobacterium gaetbulicola Gung47 TaxID=658445 RepID=A0A0C5WNP0_9GAMM|nr:hypothetical protein [Photobacterium gaetbulicola]AJR06679.1 hypothetical protein H744_1c1661 [Photobacterium gaetbulicola Gung47]PSU13998.1 hypothetical protein C9J03_03575 [Photobacterium gaetbulicola]